MLKRQTSLFNINEITTEIEKEKPKSYSVKTKEQTKIILGKIGEKVNYVIGKVTMGETIHYVSKAEWSMHNLLFHILKQTGAANVYIASWSISENAINQLLLKIKDKSIIKLHCIFDWRVKVRSPKVYELAKFNISNIGLTSCHAKVTVIKNKNWNIAIVGSANYTNNPRIEAGVISCNTISADFHKNWIEDEMKKSYPFETKKRNKNA